MTLDFTADESLAFLGPLKSASVIPEWLQKVTERSETDSLPNSAFADTVERLMPIHTKEATWLSAVSSYAYGTPHGTWVERLKSACHAYGIVDSVKAACDVLRPSREDKQKEASEQSAKHYALTLNTPDGQVNLYPINNSYEIEKSARDMLRDRREKRFPEAWLVAPAERICKSADDHGLQGYLIPKDVRDLGTPRLPDLEMIEYGIEERLRAGLPKEAAHFYREAADLYTRGETDLESAALVWELADRKFELDGKCASGVRTLNSGLPMTLVEKRAKEIVRFQDQWVPLAAFQTMSKVKLAALLPQAVASELFKCADAQDGREVTKILSTLDEDSCRIVIDILLQPHGNS